MGKGVVKIKLTNLFDQAFFNRGIVKKKPRSLVLDLVVDSKGGKLIANPAHGGEQMTEEY